MTAKRISFALALGCLLISTCAHVCPGQGTSKAIAPKAQRVKIYFYHEPGEYIDLSPVTRMIRSAAPGRAVIQALLAGPTAAEEKRGFGSLDGASAFRIGSLKITQGIARVNFVSSRKWMGWSGDLAPIRFKKAVELTLGQFPSVQRVIVSLDGDVNFASAG